MAVNITSPQSAVIARGSFNLSWTHDYPQARYEILYRRKGETAWSTFGQVTSTQTNIQVNCNDLYCKTERLYINSHLIQRIKPLLNTMGKRDKMINRLEKKLTNAVSTK